MSQTEEIMDVLGTWGVHEGWPEERRQMAAQLAGYGLTEKDISMLIVAIDGSSRNTAAAAAAVLADPAKAMARVKDLRLCRQKQPEPATKQAEPVDRIRLRRMAFAIVVADQKSRQYAAECLDVSEAELDRLVAEEKQARLGG